MGPRLSRLSQMSEHWDYYHHSYQRCIRILLEGNYLVSFPYPFHHILAAWLPQACSTLSQAWGHSCPAMERTGEFPIWEVASLYQPSLASVLDWTWTPAPGETFHYTCEPRFPNLFSSTFSNASVPLSSLRLFTSTILTIETGYALTRPSGEWSLVLA